MKFYVLDDDQSAAQYCADCFVCIALFAMPVQSLQGGAS